MDQARRSPWTVIAALVATIAVNYLAIALPLGGNTTEELSDRFPVVVTPAGYAFSIWSLIYLGLIAFAIYQALPAYRDRDVVAAIRGPFLLSSLANIAWIFLWHYEQVTLSLVAMVTLLGSLLVIYRRVAARLGSLSSLESWTVRWPFSLYLGWITVATIVNTSVVLYNFGWRGDPLTASAWGVLLIAVATSIALLVSTRMGDPVYGAVIAWALVGITVQRGTTDGVGLAAAVAAALVALGVAWVTVQVARGRESRLLSGTA